jgi:hypothetical protein
MSEIRRSKVTKSSPENQKSAGNVDSYRVSHSKLEKLKKHGTKELEKLKKCGINRLEKLNMDA